MAVARARVFAYQIEADRDWTIFTSLAAVLL
jgi:hypothetical protein